MTLRCCAWLAWYLLAWPAAFAAPEMKDERFRVGAILFRDDFSAGLENWTAELERGGRVEALDGSLIIDVPAGCTVWFKPLITGPVMIEYEAVVISAGGPNDRVSDLNCFWMARDSRSPDDLFGHRRSGKFTDYHQLLGYYAGFGGNRNTTTRFRRYIGDAAIRPLRPEHDLTEPVIVPNVPQTLRLVACGSLIQFHHDERRLFEMDDPDPYTSGWFGFRTVNNHMSIRRFRVHRLLPAQR
jgi:hypothetical protein